MRLRLAIWFLLLSGVVALGLGNNGVPPWFGTPAAFSTWNPSDKSANITLTNFNLTAQSTNTTDGAVRGTKSHNSGKVVFEVSQSGAATGVDSGIGIATGTANLGSVGSTVSNALLCFVSGNVWFNTSNLGAKCVFNNAGVQIWAIDFTNSRAWVKTAAGNWNLDAAADPATNTNGINISAVFPSSAGFPITTYNATGPIQTLNVGATALNHAIPSGFAAWNFLLRRDIDPAANLNCPMFTEAVA